MKDWAELPAWMWRDPADVAERVEAATCRGCVFIVRRHIAGELVESCGKNRRYGKKCKRYVEEGSGEQ